MKETLMDELRVLLKAVATRLPLIQSLLTWAAVEVVPLLPDNLAVRATAVLVVVAGWVAVGMRLVSVVTPVPAAGQGLVLPANRAVVVEVLNAAGKPIARRTVTPPG